MSKQAADLILHSGIVLTLDDHDRMIEKGAVAIRGGIIVAVGKSADVRKDFSARKSIDARGGIILPGFVNTHTHLAMSIFRGCADDLPLDEWLQRYIFPLEDRYINRHSVYWGSLLSCAEMVLSGTTTCCDMYFCEAEAGRAAEKIGMRALIGEGMVAMGENADAAWQKKRALTVELMKRFRKSKLVSVAVEPHSPYTCDAATLVLAKAFATEHHLPYVIHLAETKQEVADLKAQTGMTPVKYLDSLGVLDADTLIAHAVWVNGPDIDILRKRDVKIAHCAQSNMKLASGIAPVARYLKNKLTVSLGTDGSASNNSLDMLREMKAAALLSKVSSLDPRVFSAREVLRAATIEGARALGKEQEIGSLETGKRADLIIVSLNAPHLTPVYDHYSHLVYAATGTDVTTSVVEGQVIMENRQLKHVALDEVMAKVNRISRRIQRGI